MALRKWEGKLVVELFSFTLFFYSWSLGIAQIKIKKKRQVNTDRLGINVPQHVTLIKSYFGEG